MSSSNLINPVRCIFYLDKSSIPPTSPKLSQSSSSFRTAFNFPAIAQFCKCSSFNLGSTNRSFAQEMTIRLVLVGSRFLFFFFLVAIAVSGVFASNGSMETEKTLAMIKPDGLRGNYSDRIKMAILESGFRILKERIVELDEDRASRFYAEHSSRSFFSSLVKYMTSGPVCIMVLEKQNAIADWRAMIGPTDAKKAKATHPNSIRAMCGLDLEKNCVHGSDSLQSAQREISFFFEEEIGGMVGKHDEL